MHATLSLPAVPPWPSNTYSPHKSSAAGGGGSELRPQARHGEAPIHCLAAVRLDPPHLQVGGNFHAPAASAGAQPAGGRQAGQGVWLGFW